MNNTAHKSIVVIAACLIAGCGSGEPAFDRESYEAETEKWRSDRLARLKGPDGYLNLAGLFWLEEGATPHRFGG